MPYLPIAIAAAACLILAATGVPLLIVAAVFAAWAGSSLLMQSEAPQKPQPVPELPVDQSHTSGLIELIDAPIIMIDGDRIIAANDAAQRIAGTHIVGQDPRVALRHPEAIRLLTSDADEERAQIKGLLSPRSVWSIKVSRIKNKLRLIQLEDLTAQADISRAHTDFVANASHELRTPLSAIIGYIETLADDRSKIDPATRARFFETMGREARRMHSLVEDLMSLSRIEAEKHDAPQERVDLVSIAKAVAKDVNAVAGKERVTVDMPENGAFVAGEHAQLDQVIRNLIDNATKYGTPDTLVRMKIAHASKGRITISVSDEGPGIPAEHIPYLTRRFYRTDPGRSRASGGTGLGLAIVKHVVERHRGQLDIASEVGVGSVVTITFPTAL